MYLSYIHYAKQTKRITTIAIPMPFICDAIPLLRRFRNGENKQPIIKWVDDAFGPTFNKSTIVFPSNEPLLVICDVHVVELLYTTHNVLFDKHPLVQNLTLNLTGHSILFDESNASWR